MSRLAMQFDDREQQHISAQLGMWMFLGTEVLFFSGLFVGYIVYRDKFPQAFVAGSRHLSVVSGSLMTAVLLTSSLTVALAHDAAGRARRKTLVRLLLATIALGVAFLGLKFHEYWETYHEGLFPGRFFDRSAFPVADFGGRSVELFFCFYYFMTGLHAVHMIVGVGMLSILAWLAQRGAFDDGYDTPVEMIGLYWHFVDIVWVFLFPLLYLVGGGR